MGGKLSADYQFNLLNADLRDFVYPRRHTLLASIATALRFKQVELQASLLETYVHDTSSGTPAPDKQKLTPSFSCRGGLSRKADSI